MRTGVDCKGKEWEETDLPKRRKNLSGQCVERLFILFPVILSGRNGFYWLCKCECGNIIAVNHDNLTSKNHTKSCGCLQKEFVAQRWEEYREENNIIGKVFGRLTTKRFIGIKNQEAIYEFDCMCGNTVELSMHSVKQLNTRSCGCLRNEFIEDFTKDIIGKKFGKLTVSYCVGVDNYGQHIFHCNCDCGGVIDVSRNSLIMEYTKSCGCVRSVGENNIKEILEIHNIKYNQQQSFKDLISDFGGYPLYDFSILDYNGEIKRLIEFDGLQHNKPYDYFGGEEKFLKVKSNDILKNKYALSHNIPLVRIPYSKRDSMCLDDLFGDKYLIKEDAV